MGSGNKFCLELDSSNVLHLKRKHVYYHQCQLQLFVSRDMSNWCDFVVATENYLFSERISLDNDWVSCNIHDLECFYDSFILPRSKIQSLPTTLKNIIYNIPFVLCFCSYFGYQNASFRSLFYIILQRLVM